MTTVDTFCEKFNTSRPQHSPGSWNVGKVLVGQDHAPVMLGAWCSRATAIWWLGYYRDTYPQFEFCLIGSEI